MSNENWTKGEWVVHDNGNFFDIGVKRDSDILPAYPSVCIGVPYHLEANAHLIAAAPDLYAALRAFVDNSSVQCNYPSECEAAELALAKARGEL